MRAGSARRAAPLRFPGGGADDLCAGRDALARHDFEAAREGFAAALARQESAEGFHGLAEALLWLGRTREAIDAWSRAFQLATRDGDPRLAAAAAIHLAVAACDSLGEELVARGWLHRARMVLERLPEPAPEAAWLAVWEAHFAFFDGDAERVRARLAEAADLARRFGIADVEIQVLGLDGLLRVTSGAVDDGLRLLDTATTAAISGEMAAPVSNGQVCCYQLRACEQIHAFDRASRWLTGIRARAAGVSLTLSYCRSHYSKILMWRGDWAEAEAELATAIEELRTPAPAILPMLQGLLGELHRRQGRTEEAEALLAGAEGTAGTAFSRAAIALSRGDAAAALDLVERGFRRLMADDRVGRAPGLELAVLARCARGELEAAEALAAELAEVARAAGSDGLRAAVAAARGHVAGAGRDADAARRAFEDAVDLYERAGSRYGAAHARLGLAGALADLGREAAARDEAERARATFAALGAAADERCAAELATRLARPEGTAASAHGLTDRQAEVLRLVTEGLSNRAIGERLHLSEYTVKRHVADILTRLDLPSRAAAAAFAVQRGLAAAS